MRIKRYYEWIPSQPFADWLNETIAEYEKATPTPTATGAATKIGAQQRLVRDLGWSTAAGDTKRDNAVRKLFRYRHQMTDTKVKGTGKSVSRAVPMTRVLRHIVEDALHRYSGGPDLFYELYSEFAPERDIVIELDAWCPHCEQLVTPIDGLCPFCTCEHGHLFREVGITADGFACLACESAARRDAQLARRAAA